MFLIGNFAREMANLAKIAAQGVALDTGMTIFVFQRIGAKDP